MKRMEIGEDPAEAFFVDALTSEPALKDIMPLVAYFKKVSPFICKKYLKKPSERGLPGTLYEQHRLILTRLASKGWLQPDERYVNFTPTPKFLKLIACTLILLNPRVEKKMRKYIQYLERNGEITVYPKTPELKNSIPSGAPQLVPQLAVAM